MPKSAGKSSEEKSFESAMQRLNELVAEMESADLPLDEVIARYEEGTKLARFCEGQLGAAEERIKLLTENANGEVESGALNEDSAEAKPVAKRKKTSSKGKAAGASGKEEVDLF